MMAKMEGGCAGDREDAKEACGQENNGGAKGDSGIFEVTQLGLLISSYFKLKICQCKFNILKCRLINL